MANAKQCDRCKKLYLPETSMDKIYRVYPPANDYRGEGPVDLCSDCHQQLIRWLKGDNAK